jgi:hypothetical protein
MIDSLQRFYGRRLDLIVAPAPVARIGSTAMGSLDVIAALRENRRGTPALPVHDKALWSTGQRRSQDRKGSTQRPGERLSDIPPKARLYISSPGTSTLLHVS